jgi:catechol 2,3-dioxygenase-like lactoylglutathione lyase family enzyme
VIRAAHFILYVCDQAASRDFYVAVLDRAPRLDVAGMTELALDDGSVLGLMPEAGIARLLGPDVDPARLHGVGRAELYLVVDDPAAYHARALAAGAREVSPLAERAWGHRAAYSLDPDGHVLGVASPL